MFYNYLTGYKAYLKKHVKSVFPFSNTTGMTREEVKAAVRRMTVESALPIPEESYNWFAQYFRYVGDKDAVLVYDNRTGVWHYERSDMSLRALITDYFTAVSEVASQHDDILLKTYASSFFASSRISQIAERIKSSVAVRIERGVDITLMTEQYRYLPTTDGRRVVIDMNADTFNAEVKTFAETQDMMFTGVGAIPIELGDDWTPHYWLARLDEYTSYTGVTPAEHAARKDYFEKILAYMFAPYNYNQVLLYWLGESGKNGKSTVLKVVQDLLGPLATRMNSELLNAKPAASFKKDDALAATDGRSLLIFNEIDERMVVSTQNIKDITEGGRDEFGNRIMTTVRPAYSPNYEVNIAGTPLVVANSLLNFGDWSALEPAFRRLILMPFDYIIAKEDPTVLNKLAQEYPKILRWFYEIYFKHKGIKLKDEPKPTSIERRYIQFRKDSDIIGLFWEDCVVDDPNSRLLRSDLYKMYVEYCKANGRIPIKNKGSNGFSYFIDERFIKRGYREIRINGQVLIGGIARSTYYEKEIV